MIKIYKRILISLLLFTLAVTYGAPSISIGAGCTKFDVRTPLSSQPGTAYGGIYTYYIVEVNQNTVKTFSNPIFSFRISCPDDIEVSLASQYGASLNKVEEFWQTFKPTRVSSKVDMNVTGGAGTQGEPLHGTYDVMNNFISGGGVKSTYTARSTLRDTEILVEMRLHPFYFYSNAYLGYRSWELPPIDGYVEVRSRGELLTIVGPHLAFFAADSICKVTPYTTTVSPAVIDFGSIRKNEIENGKVFSRSFTMDLTLQSKNCKGVTTSPKVFFLPQDTYYGDNIYLDNGLMMTFKDNNKPIPMAKSYTLGQISNNKLNKTFNVELKKGNIGEEIKSGPFSSTVIYLMEYF